MTTDDTRPLVIHCDYADHADFTEYRKVGTTRISNRRFPPGTIYDTPEGFVAENEDTRCAVDVQGGIYPIRESVFRAVYVKSDVLDLPPTIAEAYEQGMLAERARHAALVAAAEKVLEAWDWPGDVWAERAAGIFALRAALASEEADRG